jgi:hypothetical protein
MSDLSNYAEGALYDWLTGRANAPATTTRYLALFSAVTDAEAGTGTEVTGGTHAARVAVAFGAHAGGAGSNSGVIDVGPMTGAGTATHAALFDALTGGNPITAIKPLAASRTYAINDIIRFAVGEIDATLL